LRKDPGCGDAGAEDAELRLFELRSPERERGDQQRHSEADPGDGARTEHRRPADGRPQPAVRHACDEPRAAEDPERLADHVAAENPEGDRRAEGAAEERAADGDAGVREREERHDQVARPRVVELLEPLVARRRREELRCRGARELRRRLLAELPEPRRRLFELPARRRVRVGQHAGCEPDHHRVDVRLEQRHPRAGAEREIDEPVDADG
jgi:hypothetical protein